jgi:hypothetical protein
MRNVRPRSIQELAGHRDRDLTTTQRYMHLSPNMVFDAIRLLEVGHPTARCDCGDGDTLIRKSFGWKEIVVTQIFTSWNQTVSWLRQLQGLRACPISGVLRQPPFEYL